MMSARQKVVFIALIILSAAAHAIAVVRLRVPEASSLTAGSEVLVTLTAPPVEAPPEPEPELPPEEVVVTSAPVVPVDIQPIEPNAIPDETIPPMDETHELPTTEFAEPVEVDVPATVRSVQGDATSENIVRTWLERHKRYPRVAVVRKMVGEATLFIRLAPDGSVVRAAIVQSSGHKVLDDAVLEMVERANPFPLIDTSGTTDTEYTIPIDFSLE